MKKLLCIVLAVVVLLGYSIAAKAVSVNATVPLTLTIPAAFGFVLDKYSWDFGTVNTSAGAQTTFSIFCRSNHGIAWKLQLAADPFQSTVGDVLASDPGFTMSAWAGAPSTDPEFAQGSFPYVGAVPDTTAPVDFYLSTVAEGADPFVPITLGLYLTIPSLQASGLYSTDMIITMYE